MTVLPRPPRQDYDGTRVVSVGYNRVVTIYATEALSFSASADPAERTWSGVRELRFEPKPPSAVVTDVGLGQ